MIEAANMPTMHPVQSSNVEAIGHAGTTLHVRFKGGAHYTYDGVDAKKFADLKASNSKGTFIHQHVKPHHAHRKH